MSCTIPLIGGEFYHVYNRGINGADLFFEERNYRHFLRLYSEQVHPVMDTFAYCLMKNHFHLLVRPKLEQDLTGFQNLSAPRALYSQCFSNCFNAYTKAINRAYGRSGSLFERPFKRIRVESERHLLHLVSYIHRNARHHGFVPDFRAWPHSSYVTLGLAAPSRIRRDEVLGWFGSWAGFESYHQQFDEAPIRYLIAEDKT
jgi:REP element-mobilizing transposase RayT